LGRIAAKRTEVGEIERRSSGRNFRHWEEGNLGRDILMTDGRERRRKERLCKHKTAPAIALKRSSGRVAELKKERKRSRR